MLEYFLDTAIEMAQYAHEEACEALELVKDDPNQALLYEAQNNLAYYLAERGIMRDAGQALNLVEKLCAGIEYFRKHKPKDKWWYEFEETRAKVLLTYHNADAQGQDKTADRRMAEAREREACSILQNLLSNSDIPEPWRHGLRERYKDHCPA